MVKDSVATVVQWRFTAVMLHFIAVLVALFHRDANVAASLPPNAGVDDMDSADAALTAALVMSLLLFGLHFVGLFAGFSLFMRRISLLSLLLHATGAVLTAWFVLDAWAAPTYWLLWLAFNLVPAIGEVLVLLATFCIRTLEW